MDDVTSLPHIVNRVLCLIKVLREMCIALGEYQYSFVAYLNSFFAQEVSSGM